ncbi:hypothetical protein ACFE04_001577 [Oxalis oulophora]
MDIAKILYVIFAFFSAFILGLLKGLAVGPIACLILIIGNIGVILGLFPSHVGWTLYTVLKSHKFDSPLRVALLLALPPLFGIWLVLSIAGSVLVGLGYGFFTPWIATFEAFRPSNDSDKFFHCLVDGTWGTIRGSCTVVSDFYDVCYHSYPAYLKELREIPRSEEPKTLRLLHVPGCIIVGLVGLLIDFPLFTIIAVIKSPYMLFKGWFRLTHDLFSREGPFLETACIPIAGLAILLWPLVVFGSIIMAVLSSIFIGLYASVIVFQERSLRRGISYVIAMVAEFDEYSNDWLYIREGTVLPKPRYRKKNSPHSSELSVGGSTMAEAKRSNSTKQASGMLVPNVARSRSVREVIQEVKMVQIWQNMLKSCEIKGKELLDAGIITPTDIDNWLKNSDETTIISCGLPCYSLLHMIFHSIKAGTGGFMLLDNVEVTHLNRPNDKLLDWFFTPVMVLKEQIRVINLSASEIKYLEKLVLQGSGRQSAEDWDNGGVQPQDALRAAQIEGISRRLIGMVKNISKFPTYRRMFRQVLKSLLTYASEKEEHNSSVLPVDNV